MWEFICRNCGKKIVVTDITKPINHYHKCKTNMTRTTNMIKNWSVERGLHNADPNRQMLKLMEEVGEIAQGMAKGKREQIKDSIGDVYVVLVILAQQHGMSIEECAMYAYNEIKDRKGKMVNGVFVKEDDLK